MAIYDENLTEKQRKEERARLERAVAALHNLVIEVSNIARSRPVSIAITKSEEAMMWFQKDHRLKDEAGA